MQIKIAERLRPYSHQPGTDCLLPGSNYRLQVFPTRVCLYRIERLTPEKILEIPLALEGPVEDFTVQQDLEKGRVYVWGQAVNGFFRYYFAFNEDKKICLCIEKGPNSLLEATTLPDYITLAKQDASFTLQSIERLSLGNHKAQDWDLVCRRTDLVEIFPAWYLLGQLSPPLVDENVLLEGTAQRLSLCQQAIANHAPEHLKKQFTSLFKAGFQGILSPRLIDDQFQGLSSSEFSNPSLLSPMMLLKQGAKLIRQLFVTKDSQLVRILPSLPPEFHCGRLLNVRLDEGHLDFEWTKKCIRRLIFRSKKECQIQFSFKNISSFRLRKNKKEQGERILNHFQLSFEKNVDYFFDNFE